MSDQAIQFATTQRNGGTLRQRRFVGHINHWASFAATDINQQTRCTLHCFVLQCWIDTTLIAVRSIGMQTVTARTTGNRQRAEERTFQQNVLRFIIHTRVLTTKDTPHGQRFVVVSNHQRIRTQFCFATVKQNQGFPFFCHTHNNPAFNAVFVERVHRLAQFKQHIVGHVNHGIDGANTATAQFLFHPQRRWRLNIDAFHHAAQIAWASFYGFDLNRQDVANGGRYWRHFRLNQRSFVQHSHIARHTNNA